jgi:molybdopterin molybdotransferase
VTGPVELTRALELAAARAPDTGAEQVPVGSAAGRVLAHAVNSAGDIPAFTNSALDGFAVRSADTPGDLRVVGETRAGQGAGGIGPGEAVAIATGAPLPIGADAILRVEDARGIDPRRAPPEGLRVVRAIPVGTGVRSRGDDMATGNPLLPAGHQVRALEVGLIAGAGRHEVPCRIPPRVALIVTGDEVQPPGAILSAGQVWDAASAGVPAVLAAGGAEVIHVGGARDDARATTDAVARAREERPDIIVTVGGISVGAHDHVRGALEVHGLVTDFHGVLSRPGQPALVGGLGTSGPAVLALPGNPVSAVVVAHVLGRPLLGHAPGWRMELPLAHDHTGPGMPRVDLLRCRIRDGGLVPLPRQQSHHLSSLADADVLAWLPPHAPHVAAGTLLRVESLPT